MKVSRTVLTGGMAETYRKVTRPVPTHYRWRRTPALELSWGTYATGTHRTTASSEAQTPERMSVRIGRS